MPKSKLSSSEKNSLIVRFCQSLSQIKNPNEAAKYMTDLLSKSEIEKLSIRLKIAELLIAEKSYLEICSELKTSKGTVARVGEWLKLSGEGYRLILQRMESVPKIGREKKKWGGMKRLYPQYYWPEILLEEIIYGASSRQKQRLEKIVNSLDRKDKLHFSLSEIFKQKYSKKHKSKQKFNGSNR